MNATPQLAAVGGPAPDARVDSCEDVALFPTHVKVLRWRTAPGFNERLAETCLGLRENLARPRLPHRAYNLWHDTRPEIQELRRMFEAGMGSYVDSFMNPKIKKNYDFEMHAWLRIDRPMLIHPPHSHPGANLAATYYPLADIADRKLSGPRPAGHAQGDLVLLDPRAGVRHGTEERPHESTYSIRPEPGTMVIIPGFLCHWVNPVSKGDRRVCIANNMMFVRKIRRDVPGKFAGIG